MHLHLAGLHEISTLHTYKSVSIVKKMVYLKIAWQKLYITSLVLSVHDIIILIRPAKLNLKQALANFGLATPN